MIDTHDQSAEGALTEQTVPLSKTAYVLQRLREEISQGYVVAGESLRQADIAQRYGVSATPVREALRLLESDGTITYSPHRGATVSGLSAEATQDLYALRESIEGLATQLAVERMTPEALEVIVRKHEHLKAIYATAQPMELSQLNRDLHLTLYSAGSTLIANQVKQIWGMLTPRSTIWSRASNVKVLVSEHDELMEAVISGDASRAKEMMMSHISSAREFRLAVASGL